jgi:hypothetical protein
VTPRLLVLVPNGRRSLPLYALNSRGSFAQISHPTSWQTALQQIRLYAALYPPLTVVVAGDTPFPDDRIHNALHPLVDALVLIPDPWLADIPTRPEKQRARRAARLAAAHLKQRIELRHGLADQVPF